MEILERLKAKGLVEPAEDADRLVRVNGKGYLLRPIDAWGKATPEWTDRLTAFPFTLRQANAQRDYLGWKPHKLKAYVEKRNLIKEK